MDVLVEDGSLWGDESDDVVAATGIMLWGVWDDVAAGPLIKPAYASMGFPLSYARGGGLNVDGSDSMAQFALPQPVLLVGPAGDNIIGRRT